MNREDHDDESDYTDEDGTVPEADPKDNGEKTKSKKDKKAKKEKKKKKDKDKGKEIELCPTCKVGCVFPSYLCCPWGFGSKFDRVFF